MKNIGVLFDEFKDWDKGFSKDRTRKAYELFSVIARQHDLKLLFSTFTEYENSNLKKCWSFEKEWTLGGNEPVDMIFDRMCSNPKNDKAKIRLAREKRLINNIGLSRLGWDKVYTYDYFSEIVPRTFAINNYNDLQSVIHNIGGEKLVIKPRYGIMGKDVQFVDKKNLKDFQDKKLKHFVVQEFIDTSKGIKELGIEGVHDLRVIIVGGEVIHSYVRAATPSCLTANCAKGAKKIFLDKIPLVIEDLVKDIDSKLEKYPFRIYSVDFAFDEDQRPWLMEIESIPGFAYYDNAQEIRIDLLKKMSETLKKAVDEPYEPKDYKEEEQHDKHGTETSDLGKAGPEAP